MRLSAFEWWAVGGAFSRRARREHDPHDRVRAPRPPGLEEIVLGATYSEIGTLVQSSLKKSRRVARSRARGERPEASEGEREDLPVEPVRVGLSHDTHAERGRLPRGKRQRCGSGVSRPWLSCSHRAEATTSERRVGRQCVVSIWTTVTVLVRPHSRSLLVQRLLHAPARAKLPPREAPVELDCHALDDTSDVAARGPARYGRRTVADPVNRGRTQNGHIRNDTRDISRLSSRALNQANLQDKRMSRVIARARP